MAGLVMAGASVASGALDLVGSFTSASAQKRALESQARAAEINAETSMREMNLETSLAREDFSKFRGSQNLAVAASGVLSDSGSAAEAISESVMSFERDIAKLKQRGKNISQSYLQQADASRQQKKLVSKQLALSTIGTVTKTGLNVASGITSGFKEGLSFNKEDQATRKQPVFGGMENVFSGYNPYSRR